MRTMRKDKRWSTHL